MSQRSALVTGATGCLGRHLVRALLAAGYRVRATGRNARIGAALPTDANFAAGDLAEPGFAETLVTDIDVVFHCAALSSPWGRSCDFTRANVDATRRLLAAALAEGCARFVHVSTPSVCFDFRNQTGVRESDPLPARFANDYAATKAEAERIVLACSADIAVTIVRPRGLVGEFDTAIAPRLLKVGRRGVFPIFRGGQSLIEVTYAGNAADALVACDRPGAPGGIFNITNDEPLRMRALLSRFFSALDMNVAFVPLPYAPLAALAAGWEAAAYRFDLPEPLLLPYSLGMMTYDQTLDISRARRDLGYVPRVGVDEGIARFAAWQRAGSPPWFAAGGGQVSV